MSEVIKVSDNVYIVSTTTLGLSNWLATHIVVGNEGLVIIDPGPNVCIDGLLNILMGRFDLSRVRGIALTHIHLDHGGGAGLLRSKLGNVRVFAHPRGVKHLSDPGRLWSASIEVLGKLALTFGEPLPIDAEALVGLDDGASIELGGVSVNAIHTPGHASHHIAYLVEPDNVLIAGDALGNIFSGRIYPVSVPPFNLAEYLRSLNKLSSRKYDAISVAHFGYVRDANEVLIQRFKDKIVTWSVLIARYVISGVKDPEEVFGRLLKADSELEYVFRNREVHELVAGSTYRAVLGVYQYIFKALQDSSMSLADFLNTLYQL